MEVYNFEITVVLTGQATEWIFSWTNCCRNAQITTIQNIGGVGGYFFATLDNFNFTSNNSPEFNDPYKPLFCLRSSSTWSFHSTDIDGDSLVYSLVATLDNFICADSSFGTQPAYVAPYSPVNPIASSTPIFLNPINGVLGFTLSQLQSKIVAVQVDEYRNGVKVGCTRIDEQFTVLNGLTFPGTITGKVFNDLNNNQILAQVNRESKM